MRTLQEIRADIIITLSENGYEDLNFEPESFEGHLVDLMSERIFMLEKKNEANFNNTPATAVDAVLDSFALLKNIKRFQAQSGSGSVFLVGYNGTVVPQGAEVRDQSDNRYRTLSEVTLDQVCSNLVHIHFNVKPTQGSFHVDINGDSVMYSFDTTDLSSHPQISSSYETESGILCVCSGIPDNVSVLRSGDLDAVPRGVILETSELFRAEVQVIAVRTGDFTSRAYEVTSFVVRPEGVLHTYNPTATLPGRARETDAELFDRFNETPGTLGASIDGIILMLPAMVNEGQTEDLVTQVKIRTLYGAGPQGAPNPIEVFVAGGNSRGQMIAEALRLRLAAAGIDLEGDETFTVIDSEGEEHQSRFSRPTEVEIHVRMDIEVDAGIFPEEGEQLIKDAIVSYGTALGIGKRVIRIPGLVGAFSDTPGILNLDNLELSTNGSTWFEDNVDIDSFEVSMWAVARIEVNLV